MAMKAKSFQAGLILGKARLSLTHGLGISKFLLQKYLDLWKKDSYHSKMERCASVIQRIWMRFSRRRAFRERSNAANCIVNVLTDIQHLSKVVAAVRLYVG